MIRSPAGFDGEYRIKRYLDYYQPSYGVMMLSAGASFSPASLFAAGEQGAWYDVSDITTMFQDAAGTIPVTAAGQPVGRINDKSGRGNHATQSTAGARPILQQDAGSRWYLALDGTDDVLSSNTLTQLVAPWEFWAGVDITTGGGILTNLFSLSQVNGVITTDSTEGLFQRSDGAVRNIASSSRIAAGTSYVATLTSGFTIGNRFIAKATAETGPDQLRATTVNGTATAAAVYTGTPSTTPRFNIGANAGGAVWRFYGGLAIDRALAPGEATQLDNWFKARMGL